MTMEPSDATNLSAVEVYCKQHEVTATVCSHFCGLSMFLMRCILTYCSETFVYIFLSNIVYHLVSYFYIAKCLDVQNALPMFCGLAYLYSH